VSGPEQGAVPSRPDRGCLAVMPSFATVTELPGAGMTPEQAAMLYTRYHWAGTLSEGRDVLEVACGPGVGLGYLAHRARRIVGGDCDEALLQQARAHYRSTIPLLRLDAHALPFAERVFDIVVLFEALYYLARPEEFLREARRVLRPRGVVLVCLPNKDWAGFNPSPFAHRYFSVAELRGLLTAAGFAPRVFGGFPAAPETFRERLVLAFRQAAVRMQLIPKTMRAKERVKRLLYRRLVPVPAELHDGTAAPAQLAPLGDPASAPAFKVLYAVGQA